MTWLLAILIAFFLGSLPFSAWIARLRGVDLRKHGSGNIGATNVYRVVGWKEGIVALLFDMGKGTAGVLIARVLAPEAVPLTAVAGLSAVAGHMFTPFAGFRGGKGVATGAGVFLGLAPLAAVAALLVWGSVLAYCGWVSVASGIAAILLPAFVWSTRDLQGDRQSWVLALALLTTVLVLWRHRTNWKRVAEGKEQAIWEKRRETPEGGAER